MITNMSYDGVPASAMMGTAAQTASLGDQDMMTYIPTSAVPQHSQAQQQRGSGSSPGAGGGNARSHGGASAAHHQQAQEDDAAMSADLLDLFGDGTAGVVDGMHNMSAVVRTQPPSVSTAPAPAAFAGGHHPCQSPVGTSVSFQNAQQQQAQHGNTPKPTAVSDSSCSGRSNASSGGVSSVTMPANLAQHGQQAAYQVTSGLWTVDYAGMQQQQQQQQQSAWAAMTAGTAAQQQQQQQMSTGAAGGFGQAMQQPHMAKPIHVMAAVPPQQYLQQQQQQQQQQGTSAQGSMHASAAAAQAGPQHQHQHPHLPMQVPPRPPTTSAALPSRTTRPNAANKTRSNKRGRTSSSLLAVSEDEDERAKRRRERNEREQERSHQISAQIAHLKDVLIEADVSFKPDKYSTLVSVSDYIKSLQHRKALLDAEHSRLLDTIKKTSDVMANAGVHGPLAPAEVITSGGSAPAAPTSSGTGSACQNDDEDLLIFVRGLDYKTIFSSCGIALGIAAVDGRLVDCNDEFVTLTGHSSREDIVGTSSGKKTKKPMSLFNILGREGMEAVFRAMSEMLRNPHVAVVPTGAAPPEDGKDDASVAGGSTISTTGGLEQQPQPRPKERGPGRIVHQHVSPGELGSDHWSGVVTRGRSKDGDNKLRLNITLVRSHDGRPKFFNCALSPEQQDGEQTFC